jgi:hypothetical protein
MSSPLGVSDKTSMGTWMQLHRHAISGYAFFINGGAVSWCSCKQEIVTLSTAEAEYVVATHAAKEAAWLCRLKGELLTPISSPTIIYCDNQAALKLTTDDNYQARTKHIDICYHFIRQVVSVGEITIVYCPTDDITANVLMKALPAWKVAWHVAGLGIHQGPMALTGECCGIQIREEARLTAENDVQHVEDPETGWPAPSAP